VEAVAYAGEMQIRCIAFVLALALSASCESPPQPETRWSNDAALEPDFIGHSDAGIHFPEKLAGFKRGELKNYDDEGRNLSAAYNRIGFGKLIALTIYIYPAPSLTSIGSPRDVVESALRYQLDREFESVESNLLDAHPGSEALTDFDLEMLFAGETLSGRRGMYSTPNGMGQRGLSAISSFELYRFGNWWMKLRITYPQDMQSRCEGAIDKFRSEFAGANPPALED